MRNPTNVYGVGVAGHFDTNVCTEWSNLRTRVRNTQAIEDIGEKYFVQYF